MSIPEHCGECLIRKDLGLDCPLSIHNPEKNTDSLVPGTQCPYTLLLQQQKEHEEYKQNHCCCEFNETDINTYECNHHRYIRLEKTKEVQDLTDVLNEVNNCALDHLATPIPPQELNIEWLLSGYREIYNRILTVRTKISLKKLESLVETMMEVTGK